jgi:hypothetical protein
VAGNRIGGVDSPMALFQADRSVFRKARLQPGFLFFKAGYFYPLITSPFYKSLILKGFIL